MPNRIVKPNYTQVPNVIFDKMMADMSESELRVVIGVCRKTFGWQKERDRISISQIEEMTGLSRQAVIDGTKQAIARGVLERVQSGQNFLYQIIVCADDETSQSSELELVNDVDQLGADDETSQPSGLELVNVVDQLDPKLVNVVDSQKKVPKEKKETSTGTAEINIFKIYENEIGLLTAHISEELKFAEKEFPPDWIRDALHISAEQNKRNWKYALAILTRWKAEGRDDSKQRSNGNGHAPRAAPPIELRPIADIEVLRARKRVNAERAAQREKEEIKL